MITSRSQKIQLQQEINEIGAWYKLSLTTINNIYNDLQEYFANYAEIVLCSDGFEMITGGKGNKAAAWLASVAKKYKTPLTTINSFLRCTEMFPDRMFGLKLCLSQNHNAVSLYVRTKSEIEKVYTFLETISGITTQLPLLRQLLKNNQILYGLGFFGNNGIKTYSIDKIDTKHFVMGASHVVDGFVSYRIINNKIISSKKIYLPEVDLIHTKLHCDFDHKLVAFAQDKYDCAGHIGVIAKENGATQMKIYIERTGKIPTDFTAY